MTDKLVSASSGSSDNKDLITPAFQFVLNMVLEAIPDKITKQSKETQTEPSISSSDNPNGDLQTSEAVTIREQIAKHFISFHFCQPGKRCNIIPRLKQFGSNKNHTRTGNRRCERSLSPSITTSPTQYCSLCYMLINDDPANHIDQCIKNNSYSTISCVFCSIQVSTDDIKTHLCSHANLTPRLRGKQSLPNQSYCNDLAERLMLLLSIAITRGQLANILSEWLHAIFCDTQCTSCTTVSQALYRLTQHTFNSAILTDHYCSCIPIYHFILRSHTMACNKSNCPLETCRY